MCDSVTPSPPFSLLKHDDAFLVEASSTSRLTATESKPQSTKGTMGGDPLVSPELMKAMLPSRQEWKDDRGKWQQNVSLAPSSRAEVLDLQTVLAEEGTQEAEDKIAQLQDEIQRLQEQTLQWSHRSMVLTSYYANERDKRTTQQNNVVAALQTQIHQFEAFRDLTK
ncbi:hypothetical protein B5M09_006340 [Aphanomyces astaci]|uniref:Uncharacterized protein n=1 Tax=Aphanomyces astaci TaxID=112090 RepID=A0A425CQZ1_APHAT|nr:hypothetical protein B5M09_006340 [Aphanomyces astaci]